jgi:hypothetical protein
MLAYGILTAATGRGAMDTQRAALRAEALRQLRWQQGQWARILATHPPGTPCRVAATEQARIIDSLVVLQEAGEDIPRSLFPCGSRVRSADAARGSRARVSVNGLLADIARVLAWFDAEPVHQDQAQRPPVDDEAGEAPKRRR